MKMTISRAWFGAVLAALVGVRVAAEVALPADYVALEWIASTGTQFIDTGYTHAANVRIECEISATAVGNYACIFGSREGGYGKTDTALGFFVRWGGKNTPNLEYGPAGKTTDSGNTAGAIDSFPYNERVSIVYDNKTVTWTGVTKSGSITSPLTATFGGVEPDDDLRCERRHGRGREERNELCDDAALFVCDPRGGHAQARFRAVPERLGRSGVVGQGRGPVLWQYREGSVCGQRQVPASVELHPFHGYAVHRYGLHARRERAHRM